jgi:hypothetical protein
MGNICSCVNAQQVIAVAARALISQLGLDFSLNDWQNARMDGDMGELISVLDTYAKDLAKMSESSMPTNLNKVVFMAINTYTDPQVTLGVGPMNDGINVADSMHKLGWSIFYLHNPPKALYLKWLDFFLKNTKAQLITYYTGHGTQENKGDPSEVDGKNEAYYFEDGIVNDDTLAQHVKLNKKLDSLRIILLSDCCHSGSIWDLTTPGMPPNCMSISAAKDSQTAKQTDVEGAEQGIFTYYFFKFLETDQTLTANQLQSKMGPYLTRFDQNFTKETTTPSMYDEKVLP